MTTVEKISISFMAVLLACMVVVAGAFIHTYWSTNFCSQTKAREGIR